MITATLTMFLVGIVNIVAAIVATATETATIMEETEIGVIVEAPLLRVVVDTPLSIGVAGATPVALPLEEVALQLEEEGVVVAQETTTRPPQQALLQLQHLLLNTRGGKGLTSSALADSSHCRASAWIGSSAPSCGMWFLCLSCSIYFSCPLFLLGPCLSFSLLILSNRFFMSCR